MSMNQTVLEAKRIGVFHCTVDCHLPDAAGLLVEEDISTLVVTDHEGCLAGIITRTDFLRAWSSAPDWRSETVRQYMNPAVITVPETACLADVARLILEQHIHRVVVIRHTEDGKRRPIAVVSSADLIYHMLNE